MPLIIRPSSMKDAKERVEVLLKAYGDDPIVPYLMPEVSYQDKIAFFVGFASKGFGNPECKDLEVVDTETEKIVAFARWRYPRPKALVHEEAESQAPSFPPGTNVALCQAMFSTFQLLEDKYLDPEKMYLLASLAVLPDYQHRGIGYMLLKQALADADEDGAQAFLVASAAGKRLYTKLGFRDLEERALDFAELGAGGKRVTTAQIREPRQR